MVAGNDHDLEKLHIDHLNVVAGAASVPDQLTSPWRRGLARPEPLRQLRPLFLDVNRNVRLPCHYQSDFSQVVSPLRYHITFEFKASMYDYWSSRVSVVLTYQVPRVLGNRGLEEFYRGSRFI